MNYEQLLQNLLDKNEGLMILTAENRAAIRNLSQVRSNRFIDVGIAEQTMIGMATGLALRGNIPVVHALAAFLTMRAYEFIRTDIGISSLPVKIVGSVAGFLSEANGPTHQAVEDIALMRTMPNIQIFCPADEDDMLKGLPQVLTSKHPVYIRFNSVKPVINRHEDFIEGKAEAISEGHDITILTYGYVFANAHKASSLLQQRGYSVGLINMRMLNPVDEKVILNSVSTGSLIVTVEDHFITGGLYSIVCELLIRKNLSAKVFPVALNNKFFKPALLNDILEFERFTPEAIAADIENIFLAENNSSNTLKVNSYAE